MSTINDSDLFIIERSGTLYQVRSDELSTLNDTDLFVVERSGTLYKVAASDAELGPNGSTSTPVSVLTPVNGSGLNDGQSINPLSSSITNVATSGNVALSSDTITSFTETTITYSDYIDSEFTDNVAQAFFNGNLTSTAKPTLDTGYKFLLFVASGLNLSPQTKLSLYFGGENRDVTVKVSWTDQSSNTYTKSIGTSAGWIDFTEFGGVNKTINHVEAKVSFGQSACWAMAIDGVTLVDGTERKLTLSGNTNLSNFTSGKTVTQSSGHTPETSVITAAADGPAWRSQLSNVHSYASRAFDQSNFDSPNVISARPLTGVITFTNNGAVTCYVPQGGIRCFGTNANDSAGSGFACTVTFSDNTTHSVSLGNNTPSAQSTYTITGVGADKPGDQFTSINMAKGNDQRLISFYVSFNPDGSDPQWLIQNTPHVLTLTDDTDFQNLRPGDAVTQSDNNATGTITSVDSTNNKLLLMDKTGTWAANTTNTVEGPTLAAGVGTVSHVSGNDLFLSAVSSGRFIAGQNKTTSVPVPYDIGLTFTDDTNLDQIIGTATQANSDGNDFDSATSSAITTVTGGGQVTVSNCSESISAGGGAYQTGDMFGSTETTTYTRPNGSSYYSISGPDNVLTVNEGETIGVRGNGATSTTTAYMRIGNTTVEIGELPNGLWNQINQYRQVTTTSPVSGKIDRVWVESPNAASGDSGISRIIVNNQIVINGNTLTRSADLDLTDNTNLSAFAAGQIVQYGTAYSASAGNRDISGGMFTAFPGRYGDFNASGAAVTFDVTLASPVSARYIGHSMILGNYSATSNENTDIISITKLNGSTVSHSGSGSWSQLSNGYGIAHIDLGSSQSISSFTLRVDTTVSSNYYVGEGIYLGASSANTSSKIISTVPNAEIISVDTTNNSILTNGGTWNTGDTVTANFDPATLGTVVHVDGSTLYGSTVNGTFQTGKYLKGATITATAPSPSEIVFTSSNASTTAYTGTNSNLSARIWSIEYGSSSTGPWSPLGTYIDTSANTSQDGATEWATAPALTANTFYRVDVTYEGSNAADVSSTKNTFKTGSA